MPELNTVRALIHTLPTPTSSLMSHLVAHHVEHIFAEVFKAVLGED